MTTISLCKKQGDCPSLGSVPDKRVRALLINPLGFFSLNRHKAKMSISNNHTDIPFKQEKTQDLKVMLKCHKASVALFKNDEENVELYLKAQEQQRITEQLLAEITGDLICQ